MRQALTDFVSPGPSEESKQVITSPAYYTTIQAADVDGDGAEEILARFWDGMRVYEYEPPTGSDEIDGGTWKRIGTAGPFSDADGYTDPSLYTTIQVAPFNRLQAPMLFARQHSQPGGDPLVFFQWKNGGWARVPDPPPGAGSVQGFTDPECGSPACYLDLQHADVGAGALDAPGDSDNVLGRNQWGTSAWDMTPLGGWAALRDTATGAADTGPFADVTGRDCPFSAAGATGDGSGDCLGSGPAYYETFRGADVDGQPIDPRVGKGFDAEVLARASDGVRVKKWVPDPNACCFKSLATLSDPALTGSAAQWQTTPGRWASIRTGNIDGRPGDEVLALGDDGLNAWAYHADTNTWAKLPSSTPLQLLGDPWLTHPEYYATLQTGDVDGDGRDDLVARGPYGIRTFFYDRRGTGGWERYLPQGYGPFPTDAQNAAYQRLNELEGGADVRSKWTGAEPEVADLTSQASKVILDANCTGPEPGAAPSFDSCTPPTPHTGFTAEDWTAVVNEVLAENFAAQQVHSHFDELEKIRSKLFIAEGAALPAIGDALELKLAENNAASFSVPQFWSLVFGLAGTIAGAAAPELGPEAPASLSVTSYLVSALPSASDAAMNTYKTTYSGLQTQFAQMILDVDKAEDEQNQEVRRDLGLLMLVGQLRSSGTWQLDEAGMGSVANQAFSAWVYQNLMPTVFDRYQIQYCYNGRDSADSLCAGVPAGPGVIGGGQNFTTIAAHYSYYGNVPCDNTWQETCSFATPDPDLMKHIWGPVPDRCNYQPGKDSTVWTFDCSVGVDVNSSIGRNTWGFTSWWGQPYVYCGTRCPTAVVGRSAVAARAARQGAITLGRGRIGRRRAARAHTELHTTVAIPRNVRLAGAKVRLDRLLFERVGRGELSRRPRGKAKRPVKLRRRTGGKLVGRARSHPGVRIELRRVRKSLVAVTLKLDAAALRVPRACHSLPAAVSLRTPPIELETRLRIDDGDTRRLVRIFHRWRCARDARGNISRLVAERVSRHPARGGLVVKLRGPRIVRPGRRARYVAVVRNRRTDRRRERSSHRDVVLDGRGGHRRRFRELRRGQSRRLVFRRRVPRTNRPRFCVVAVATAAGARAARAKACALVAR